MFVPGGHRYNVLHLPLNFLLLKACVAYFFFGWGEMYRSSVFHISFVARKGDDE